MAAAPATLALLPGMDGSGGLAAFVAAVAPLVVSYPPDQVLCYEGLVAFVKKRSPVGQSWVLMGESFPDPSPLHWLQAAPLAGAAIVRQFIDQTVEVAGARA